MPSSDHDQLPRTIEGYFGISGAVAEEFLGELESVGIAGGDWLFHQGDPADSLYFLVRGRLQVWIESDQEGDDRPAELFGEVTPGESVGEIGLLAGGVRTAGIRAIRSCASSTSGQCELRSAATLMVCVSPISEVCGQVRSPMRQHGTHPPRLRQTTGRYPLLYDPSSRGGVI
jgi:NTE family protein